MVHITRLHKVSVVLSPRQLVSSHFGLCRAEKRLISMAPDQHNLALNDISSSLGGLSSFTIGATCETHPLILQRWVQGTA